MGPTWPMPFDNLMSNVRDCSPWWFSCLFLGPPSMCSITSESKFNGEKKAPLFFLAEETTVVVIPLEELLMVVMGGCATAVAVCMSNPELCACMASMWSSTTKGSSVERPWAALQPCSHTWHASCVLLSAANACPGPTQRVGHICSIRTETLSKTLQHCLWQQQQQQQQHSDKIYGHPQSCR